MKIFTLPETNIAHENPIFPGTYHQNGGFSMAMLVYRSVLHSNFEVVGKKKDPWKKNTKKWSIERSNPLISSLKQTKSWDIMFIIPKIIAPEKWWLGDDPFLLGRPILQGDFLV